MRSFKPSNELDLRFHIFVVCYLIYYKVDSSKCILFSFVLSFEAVSVNLFLVTHTNFDTSLLLNRFICPTRFYKKNQYSTMRTTTILKLDKNNKILVHALTSQASTSVFDFLIILYNFCVLVLRKTLNRNHSCIQSKTVVFDTIFPKSCSKSFINDTLFKRSDLMKSCSEMVKSFRPSVFILLSDHF